VIKQWAKTTKRERTKIFAHCKEKNLAPALGVDQISLQDLATQLFARHHFSN